MQPKPPFRVTPLLALHVFTLISVCLAHPILDLLVREHHATILVAHQSQAIDIWLLVALLCFGVPAALTLATWVLTQVFPSLGRVFFGLFVWLALALLLSLLVNAFLPAPGALWPILIALGSMLLAGIYLVSQAARFFVTLLSPAIVLVPLLFLANPVVRGFMKSNDAVNDGVAQAADFPNVVLIIFDELPLISLLDENGMIDEGRYPNFHALAEESNWYRNTTTIHYATKYAIPSILTGTDFWASMKRDGSELPRVMLARETFPDNLFSLLEPTHKEYAMLMTARVTGPAEDSEVFVPPLSDRMVLLVSDLAIVYAHQASPPVWRQFLPQIEGQWQDFTGKKSSEAASPEWPFTGNSPAAVKQVLDALHRSNRPMLYVAHFLLPHRPFRYNEKGQLHENKAEIQDDLVKIPIGQNNWPSQRMAELSQQAHLLQLAFTDHLLGRLLDRMRELDLFDDALLVVTADHGISFYWDEEGLPPERLSLVQASGTLYVPLFIKLPGQTRGAVSDRVVQTIDILPSIADVLDIDVPWSVDGASVFSDAPQTTGRYAWMMSRRMDFAPQVEPEQLALQRKIALFGSRTFDSLYNSGPHPELVGLPVSRWQEERLPANLEIFDEDKYVGLDPDGPEVPAYVEGEISGLTTAGPTAVPDLAIAVNGIVRVTTSAWVENERWMFLGRIPTGSFDRGDNRIEVLGIFEDRLGAVSSLARFDGQ